jgi:hypothetical protein
VADKRAESRREFLKQAGTVAWAAPLILTMAAPSAHAQTSCIPEGSPCGNVVGGVCVPAHTLQNCCGTCEPAGPNFCFCVGP